MRLNQEGSIQQKKQSKLMFSEYDGFYNSSMNT